MQDHQEKVQEFKKVQDELKKQLANIPSLIWFFVKLVAVCLVAGLVLAVLFVWHPW